MAKERTPQRLRAEPSVRWCGAGCVRMRRVKASYPQHIGRRAPKGADAPGRVARVSSDAVWATGRADAFVEAAGWFNPMSAGAPAHSPLAEIGPVPRRDRSGSLANKLAGKALAGTDGAVAMAADLQAVKGHTNGLRADSCITLRQHKICIKRSTELTRIKRRPLDVPCGRTQDDSRRRPQGRAEPFKSARRWDSPCRTPAPPTPTPPLITDPIRQRVRFACGPRN